MSTAIGIDFGTSHSCVGVFRNGNVEIIANGLGNRTMPSYVAFTDAGRIIGDDAKNQIATNPHNTVFDAKRLIGRKYMDITVQEDMKHWPFKVIDSDDGRPKVQVKFKGGIKYLHPEEISSMVLAKMKETAETYLTSLVTDAVIAVPAHFNDSQRKAIKDAGAIAGLNVLRIISEPTAAAVAYGFDKGFDNRNVLVFDLGGGTFDVSIVNIKNKNFKIKATAGDTHLGGEDFDNRLVDYFVDEFRFKYKRNIRTNPRALRRLRTACERAKRILSTITETSIEVDSIFNDIDLCTSITRDRFEELCTELFDSTLDHVKKALSDAGMDKNEIDDVVLVGGSTRIPRIQKLLSEFFDGKSLNKSINPDEAVAYGAAIQAAILSCDKSDTVSDIILEEVAPLSLGLKAWSGLITPLIKRNTTIPAKKSKNRNADKDASVHIQIFEGERMLPKDNNLLGEAKFIPVGEPQILITFNIDVNGILDVIAVDKCDNKHIIVNNVSHLSEEEIKRMVREAEDYKADDEAQRERVAAMNKLEEYCIKLKQTLDGEKLKKCEQILLWLKSNRTAEKTELESYQNEVERL